MKFWIWTVLGLALAGCASASGVGPVQVDDPGSPVEQASNQVPLKDYGPAPEMENQVWLNTDTPLRLADLGGKVVLLDMWTFG
jgi:hypothetical protein